MGIRSQKLSYINASAPDKKQIINSIISTIQSKSGRFLKRNTSSGIWECLTLDEAKKKTGQALREDAPKIKRMKIINAYRGRKSITTRGAHVASELFHLNNTARFVNVHNLNEQLQVAEARRNEFEGMKWQEPGKGHKPHWMGNNSHPEQNEQSLRQLMSIRSTTPMVTPRSNFMSTSTFIQKSPYSPTSTIPFCRRRQYMVTSPEALICRSREWNDEWRSYSRPCGNFADSTCDAPY